MFVLALSLYNTWNRGVFLLCKITNLLIYRCKIKLPNQKLTKQKERGSLMINSTSTTYSLKRKILTFTNKISCRLPKPDRKFISDMVYGILASQSCLLTDISDQLHEPARKVNTVKRLSTHLLEGPLPLRLPLISIP